MKLKSKFCRLANVTCKMHDKGRQETSSDPARSKQLSMVAILAFQFGLYYVVVPLSFLHSITPASLFSGPSIFGWWDLLQILRKPVAFSFAVHVLCIIVFRLFSILGALGLNWSVMLLIFNMVWPWFFCGTVFVCLPSAYQDNDMIFLFFPVVLCHAFCM